MGAVPVTIVDVRKAAMRIVVVGAGIVGSHVAERLSGEGHDITVIDNDAELIRHLGDRLDVLAIHGDAVKPSVLSRAGTPDADLLISVTEQDSTNLLVSLIASKMGARKCIVRVRSSELTDPDSVLDRQDVGADFLINSMQTTLNLLERIVRNPGATDVWEFAEGELLLWGYVVSPKSPLVGVKLRELRKNYEGIEALIVAIARPDGIVIPTGDDSLLAGDNIYVFIRKKATGKFRRIVHPEKEDVDKLVITGASQIAIELAKRVDQLVYRPRPQF